MHFKKRCLVHDTLNHVSHVVRFIGIWRNDIVKCFCFGSVGFFGRQAGYFFFAVLRDVAHQLADFVQTNRIVRHLEMRHPGFGVVGSRASQFLGGYFFVSNGLHHIRSRHKHVAGIFDHKNEIGECRTVHRSARTRPHNGRNLGNNARSHRIAPENLGISTQRGNSLLNAGSA